VSFCVLPFNCEELPGQPAYQQTSAHRGEAKAVIGHFTTCMHRLMPAGSGCFFKEPAEKDDHNGNQ